MAFYDSILVKRPKRSVLDLSYTNKLSMKFADLVPVMCKEVLPGDKWIIRTDSFLRFAPLLAPVYHNIKLYLHYWFVPARLVHMDWAKFISNENEALGRTAIPNIGVQWTNDIPEGKTFPTKTGQPFCNSSLADYLGVPTLPTSESGDNGTLVTTINIMPFLAYHKIFNDFYRDENLQPDLFTDYDMDNPEPSFKPLVDKNLWLLMGSPEVLMLDGSTSYFTGIENLFKLHKRAWHKDYFTSALPWAQKGNPVEVESSNFWVASQVDNIGDDMTLQTDNADGDTGRFDVQAVGDNDSTPVEVKTSFTLQALRVAESVQKFLERCARGGSRYVEFLKAHFGVISSDARLQRPQYLGGFQNEVLISDVTQTSESTDESPQGNYAGHAVSGGQGKKIKFYSEEHGFIMCIASVIPRTAYQQGIHRMFSRKDYLDYYFPEFANLGEQPVLEKELYAINKSTYNSSTNNPDNVDNESVFGYQERYGEYKHSLDEAHGDFRTSLDFWHLGRVFGTNGTTPDEECVPQLNEKFIECDPSTRIFAVEDDTDYLYCVFHHDINCVRNMPKLAIPTL